MAEGLNRWQGLGKLGADPDFRVTTGGFALLKFRIACTERYKARSGNWEERTEWVPCTVLGARAEPLSKMISKGSTVYVEGSFHTSKYVKNEETRYATEITVSKLLLVGPKKESSGGRRRADDDWDDDKGGSTGSASGGGGGDWDDEPPPPAPKVDENDDIPF